MRSLNGKKSEKTPRVLYIFRVNPVGQNKVKKVQNTSLYLHGIKSDKIINTLESGYPNGWNSYKEQCKKECFGQKDILRTNNCSCKASNVLTTELSKGTSYCNVDGEAKKLSIFHGDNL